MWYFLAGAIGFFLAYALCPAITLQVRFEFKQAVPASGSRQWARVRPGMADQIEAPGLQSNLLVRPAYNGFSFPAKAEFRKCLCRP
jgi:hypothetical protein